MINMTKEANQMNPFIINNESIQPNNSINKKEMERLEKKNLMLNRRCMILNVPQEILMSPRWIYSNELKIPVDGNGYPSDGLDYKNLTSISELQNNNRNFYYYSYSLNHDFMVVDLDGAIDDQGNLREFAREVCNELTPLNPYIETSLSGKGLHIVFKNNNSISYKNIQVIVKNTHARFADVPNKCKIEVLTNHMITFTGNVYTYENKHFKFNGLQCINNEVKQFYNRCIELEKINVNSINKNYEKKLSLKSIDASCIFEQIKSQVSMEDVLGMYNIPVNDKGNSHCPFPDHDDNVASFKVYNYSNSWNCFGCKKGGTVIDFVMHMDNTRAIDAVKKLNEYFNLNLKFDQVEKDMDKPWVIIEQDKVILNHNLLAKHFIEEKKLCWTEQMFYVHENGVYKELKKSQLKNMIAKCMPETKSGNFFSTVHVDQVYNQLKREFVDVGEFDTKPGLFNCLNGQFEFKPKIKNDVKLQPHSADVKSRFQIKYDYVPGKRCEVFQQVLDDLLPKEQQKVLQEVFGYCCIPSNKAKKFFGFEGVGDTGKSLMLRILSTLVGEQYTSAIPLQKLTNPKSEFATWGLYGKFLNVSGDLAETPLKETNLIKMLTGDDKMEFTKKKADSVFAYNYAKMVYSMNVLPPAYQSTPEFFSRFLLMKFDRVVPKDKQRDDLLTTIDFEGVLSWAIEGLVRLMKNNYKFTETDVNKALTVQYKSQDNSVLSFLEECCEITGNKNDMVIQKQLTQYFNIYCSEVLNNDYKLPTKKLVAKIEAENKDLKYRNNLPTGKSRNGRGIVGLKINEDFLSDFGFGLTNSI